LFFSRSCHSRVDIQNRDPAIQPRLLLLILRVVRFSRSPEVRIDTIATPEPRGYLFLDKSITPSGTIRYGLWDVCINGRQHYPLSLTSNFDPALEMSRMYQYGIDRGDGLKGQIREHSRMNMRDKSESPRGRCRRRLLSQLSHHWLCIRCLILHTGRRLTLSLVLGGKKR
jgi:hypothetical protein